MAKSGYEVHLGKCLLPVTPKKIQIKINNANKTLTLINDSEINILKKAKLTDIEFDCEIPQVMHPYSVYKSGFQTADYFLNHFEQLKVSQKPFPFIVCRTLPSGKKLFNTDIMVSLEDYKIVEEAKNGFDITVKIELKQWRDYGTKTVNVTMSGTTANVTVEPTRETTNSPKPTTPQTHTVTSSDTLCNIAKYYYGDSSKYTVIYEANKDVIGGDPNLISSGQVLTIPVI